MAGFTYSYESSPHLTNEELACIVGLICKGCTRGQRVERVSSFLSRCVNWRDMERIHTDSNQAARILVQHFSDYEYDFIIQKK